MRPRSVLAQDRSRPLDVAKARPSCVFPLPMSPFCKIFEELTEAEYLMYVRRGLAVRVGGGMAGTSHLHDGTAGYEFPQGPGARTPRSVPPC